MKPLQFKQFCSQIFAILILFLALGLPVSGSYDGWVLMFLMVGFLLIAIGDWYNMQGVLFSSLKLILFRIADLHAGFPLPTSRCQWQSCQHPRGGGGSSWPGGGQRQEAEEDGGQDEACVRVGHQKYFCFKFKNWINILVLGTECSRLKDPPWPPWSPLQSPTSLFLCSSNKQLQPKS